MSLENQILDKENNKNLSEKENVNVISNSNILDNNNKINMTIKEKEEKNNNSNVSSNKMKKNNENINKNLCFNYYLLGVQQEYLKRKNDSINSFASAKLYIPQSGKNKNNNEYNFIKKIHIPKSDANTCTINFRESLSSGI